VVILTNARIDDRLTDLARHFLFAGSPLSPAPPMPARPKIVPLSRKLLDEYAGRYRMEAAGLLTVARRENHLLVDTHGDGISTYFPLRENEFFSNTNESEIVFSRDEKGRATGLIVQTGGARQSASRLVAEP
jgi:hypothetical protein